MTTRIPIANGEAVFVRPADKGASCVAHRWPDDGLARRVVQAAREAHPVGINVCVECLVRAKDVVGARAAGILID